MYRRTKKEERWKIEAKRRRRVRRFARAIGEPVEAMKGAGRAVRAFLREAQP